MMKRGLTNPLPVPDIDRGAFLYREREKDEAFPWEVVDHGMDRGELWAEYIRLKGKSRN
jgi:hypothetical protein